MNRTIGIVTAILAILLAVGAGYWLGTRSHTGPQDQADASGIPANEGKPERTILYYRNPMGQPDTSPVPKKDSMGMDYIPVYADEADDSGQVRVAPGRLQTLGVRTEAVRREPFERPIDAAGRIEADESRSYIVTAKFDGYIERLYVDTSGQTVRRGQALFEVYSPELVTAQREYAIATAGMAALKDADANTRHGMQSLADASLERLRNWDVSSDQIKTLAQSGEIRRTLTLRSPASGIVTEKNVTQGMRFAPGEVLYRITDLSTVWLIAQVFEHDLSGLEAGSAATVEIDAFPGETFRGSIAYIYPTFDTATRSVPVRVELANPDGRLKPGMFARVKLAGAARAPTLVAPASAVIDSGTERIVLVAMGEGRFEPRTVQTGRRIADRIEILDGVVEGETLVVSANFLIDAESRLKAAVEGFAAADPASPEHDGHHAHETDTIDPSLPRHQADGRVESIDVDQRSIVLTHGPVPSLHWPAMTMPFGLADPDLVRGLAAGQSIRFEFVEAGPGQWIITSITPQNGPSDAGSAPALEHDHGAMDHSTMDHSAMGHEVMDHSAMDHAAMDHGTVDHAAHAPPDVDESHEKTPEHDDPHGHH